MWLGLFLLAAAPTASAGMTLDGVLSEMDKASSNFRGMKADMEWMTYTALVDDKSVEKGAMRVRRLSPDAAELFLHFTDPAEKDVLVKGATVEIYKPKIKTVEEYDASKSKDKLDQALLIGFGASGKAIRKSYQAKLLGEETVAGAPSVHLELIPKDEDTRKSLQKLEMWVSMQNWQTVQMKLVQSSGGDYNLHTYTNIEVNPPLKDSDFKLNLPGGVKRIQPRK